MGTSKSNEGATQFVAGVLIFSGRPDPTWTIGADEAKRLKALWKSLEPYKGPLPRAPVLGYRGVFLRDSAGRDWFAYGGGVTLKTARGAESRRDLERKFEAQLLSSAPPNALPPQLIDAELRRQIN
jgi:hypothetical protein